MFGSSVHQSSAGSNAVICCLISPSRLGGHPSVHTVAWSSGDGLGRRHANRQDQTENTRTPRHACHPLRWEFFTQGKPGFSLQKTSKTTLPNWHACYLIQKIVWSDVLPRRNWLPLANNTVVDKMRKCLNRTGGGISISVGGFAIQHTKLDIDKPGIFRYDGVHLTDSANDTFVRILKFAVSQFINDPSSHSTFKYLM